MAIKSERRLRVLSIIPRSLDFAVVKAISSEVFKMELA